MTSLLLFALMLFVWGTTKELRHARRLVSEERRKLEAGDTGDLLLDEGIFVSMPRPNKRFSIDRLFGEAMGFRRARLLTHDAPWELRDLKIDVDGVYALAEDGATPAAQERLIEAMAATDPDVRRTAFAVYRSLFQPSLAGVLSLIERLPTTRLTIIEGLGRLCEPASEEELLAALDSPSRKVRNVAAEALGLVGAQRARSVLKELTEARDPIGVNHLVGTRAMARIQARVRDPKGLVGGLTVAPHDPSEGFLSVATEDSQVGALSTAEEPE